MSSTRSTHWCYTCRVPVSIRGNALCAICHGGFIQELGDMPNVSQLSAHASEEFGAENHEQRPAGVMDAFLNFMRERISGRNNNVDDTGRADSQPGRGSFGPWLIFSGQVPENSGLEELFNEAVGYRRGNGGGDYFVGPGVEEFIEELTRINNRAPLVHPDPQLMLCLQLKFQRSIFDLILIVQSAKKNSSWGLMQGKCHVTTYITQIVLFLGYFSAIHALFAAKHCHHHWGLMLVIFTVDKTQGLLVDLEAAQAAVVRIEAIATVAGIQMEPMSEVRPEECGILFPFCGL
ncbi:hypothetical protein NMG60_11001134 [Bertholletia excelsa]